MENFHIGPWLVEPRRLTLTQGHGSVVVKPRSMAVLLALAGAGGAVVSRRELMQQVWGDAEVTDDVLTQSIVELRRALGDKATQPRYIETIKRVGFRLIPEPDSSTHHASIPLWIPAVASLIVVAGVVLWALNRPTYGTSLEPSVAVMPFTPLDGDASTRMYARALTGELYSAVSGYQELRIVSGADAADARAVADAGYILGGTVQRLGENVRFRAHLVRGDDRQTVWAQSFERPVTNAMGDPAEMAAVVGRFLRVQLQQDRSCEFARRTSTNRSAANIYCAALEEAGRWGQAGERDPNVLLNDAQRVLELDPHLVGAYRLVAGAYETLGTSGAMDWRDAARHAYDALQRGLTLDPDNPWLLWTLGHVQTTLELDYQAAEATFRASLPNNPSITPWHHFALGRVELARGNLHQALEHFRLAVRMNDSNAGVYLFYAAALWCAGEYRDAIDATDAGIGLVQQGGVRLRLLSLKAMAHAAVGEMAEANAALDDALASADPTTKATLAGPLARVGRTEQARQLVRRLERLEHPPVDSMVYAYAALADDRAFDWIHRAIQRHVWGVVLTLRTDPLYTELRRDPRWDEVMAHLESEEANGGSVRRSLSS